MKPTPALDLIFPPEMTMLSFFGTIKGTHLAFLARLSTEPEPVMLQAQPDYHRDGMWRCQHLDHSFFIKRRMHQLDVTKPMMTRGGAPVDLIVSVEYGPKGEFREHYCGIRFESTDGEKKPFSSLFTVNGYGMQYQTPWLFGAYDVFNKEVYDEFLRPSAGGAAAGQPAGQPPEVAPLDF